MNNFGRDCLMSQLKQHELKLEEQMRTKINSMITNLEKQKNDFELELRIIAGKIDILERILADNPLRVEERDPLLCSGPISKERNEGYRR